MAAAAAILVAIILVILAYLYRMATQNSDYFRKNGVPEVKSIPIFGSMAPVILGVKSYAELLRDFYYSAPPEARYIGFMDFTRPMVIIRDMDLLNDITIKSFDHFVNRQTFGDIKVDPLFGNFLLSMTGDKWHAMRSTLTPSFTSLKIKTMFHLMKQCAEEFADIMGSRCKEAPLRLNMKETFSKVANDIILTTAYGVQMNSTQNPNNDFFTKGHVFTGTGYFRLMKLFLARTRLGVRVVRLLKLRVVPEAVQNFFRNVIASNIDQRKNEGVVRPDMIHLLMQAKFGPEKRDLTLDEIAAQALIFFFGGFDSVSTALTYTSYLLAKHPEIQEKLREGIDKVYEQSGGDVSYDDLKEFKYMDAVIHEAQRVLPAFAQSNRICTKRYEMPPALPGLKPFVLEPGTVVYLSQLAIHRDPRYFPKPEEFVPERFIDENGKIKEPPGYLAFGRGPRNCIANRFAMVELKVILFFLLRKVNLKLCDETIPPKRICQATAQCNPYDPVILLLESRKDVK